MKNLFVISIVLLLLVRLQGQDVIFKNPNNKVLYDYLDTVVRVSNQIVNIDIGPDHRLNQNTIFFNKLFKFQKASITNLRIKGSFLQQFVIDSSKFEQQVFFIDSTDFDTLFIFNSVFRGSILIENTHIGHFSFKYNELPGDIIFKDCDLSDFVMDSKIAGNLYFVNCTLGSLNFEGSNFEKTLDLSGNTFTGNLNFDYTSFAKNLKLKSLKRKSESRVSFLSCILPDTLDLSGNGVIYDSIDLTGVNPLMVYHRKCKLLLNGTDISKVKLNYNYFKLVFPKDLPTDEKTKVYELLLENLHGNSYQESYQALDIEYKRFTAKRSLGYFWWFPEYWWQYGYNRGNVFKITIIALLIFTLFNYIWLNYMVSKVYPVGNIPVYYRKCSLIRLWFAFVYTCVIFFSLSIRTDKINFKEKRGSVYLMLMYVFGIICLAYMANYIIQR